MNLEQRQNTLRPTGRSFYAAMKLGSLPLSTEERREIRPFLAANAYGASPGLRYQRNTLRPNSLWYGRLEQKPAPRKPANTQPSAPLPRPAPQAAGTKGAGGRNLRLASARLDDDYITPSRAAVGGEPDLYSRRYWATPSL